MFHLIHKHLLITGFICENKLIHSLKNVILVLSKLYPKNNSAYLCGASCHLNVFIFCSLVENKVHSALGLSQKAEKRFHPGTQLLLH